LEPTVTKPPDISDRRVVEAMRRVPRHKFVPEEYAHIAYENQPLPIGYGQTISQPYIVALMTAHLGLKSGDRVLEIGTGSGYQAAILAELGMDVYSVEIIPELAAQAARTLVETGYTNVHVRHGDGYWGWPEHAPYDAIIVTAAAEKLPRPLVEQLKRGGHLIIPLGPVEERQILWLFEKEADGTLRSVDLGDVAFVPFTRAEE
jgi:protein-L-isoaspartate(D-aspartate) O-methyltransferase